MSPWLVTWMDAGVVKQFVMPSCYFYNLSSEICAYGVHSVEMVLRVEKISEMEYQMRRNVMESLP